MHVPENEAILAILDAISGDPELFRSYSLKGGNALKFAFQGPRASVDIDLSSIEVYQAQPHEQGEAMLSDFCGRLDAGLDRVRVRHGFAGMYVQSRKLLPPKKNPRQFPAFQISVGYSRHANRTPPYNQIVKLDVTLNEVVCEHELVEVASMTLRISSLEDILAEKLRALLQQPIRNRNRPSDVFDVWYYATHFGRVLDTGRITRFLQQKGDAVDGIDIVTKALFRRDEIRARAAVGYSSIESRLPRGIDLPLFEDAFAGVLSLVDRLDLPAE